MEAGERSRRLLEEELDTSVWTLDVLYRLTEVVGRSRGLLETCEAAVEAILTGIGAHRASILLFDEDGKMRFVAWRGLSEAYRKAVEGHSPWSRDVIDPVPILIDNALVDPRAGELRPVVVAEGIHALGFVPLVHQGTLLGKFMVYYNEPHVFSRVEVRLAETIAHHVAYGVARAQSEEEVIRAWHRERGARHEADAAKAEAERASARKDEFLAMLAHELRNPLAVIVNSLQMLESRSMEPSAGERALQMIRRQSDHLVRLLDDLLDVARITTGRMEIERERVDLRAALEQAAEAQRHAIDRKEQRLTLSLPEQAPVVIGDPVRLQQVLANLLDNASKYSPRGGEIRAGLATEGGEAVLTVHDKGEGIPQDKLEIIFDLFTQLDKSLARTKGGLGIGLTLVKRIVKLHGGTVLARCAGKGRGTEFVVRLPLDVSVRAAAGPSATGVRRRRILLVEDQEDAREILVTVLKHQGHEVQAAASGREAIDSAARNPPEVAIVDIGLPDMDGYSVAREIRRLRQRDVFLIALTGYGQPSDRRRSKEAGFDAHLVKPLEPARLDEILAGPGQAPLTPAGP